MKICYFCYIHCNATCNCIVLFLISISFSIFKDNIQWYVILLVIYSLTHTDLAVRFLLCFSLYRNVPIIVTAKEPQGQYSCLNGIRVIATSMVVLGHTYSYIHRQSGKLWMRRWIFWWILWINIDNYKVVILMLEHFLFVIWIN